MTIRILWRENPHLGEAQEVGAAQAHAHKPARAPERQGGPALALDPSTPPTRITRTSAWGGAAGRYVPLAGAGYRRLCRFRCRCQCRCRLSAKFVSQIENGHTNPSIDVVARLVEQGLGLPMSAFFARDLGDDSRADLAQLGALLGGQPLVVRRRALRVLKALCEE